MYVTNKCYLMDRQEPEKRNLTLKDGTASVRSEPLRPLSALSLSPMSLLGLAILDGFI